MQFHLNGFQPGDPRVHPAAKRIAAGDDVVDVLIVGSGPAGLTLAAQLALFPDISTRVIEAKRAPMKLGQADGVACRTMEMFQAFGFAEQVKQEAYWVNEVSFWKPDENDESYIARSGTVQDTEDGLSEFPHVILNQARIHDHYLDCMRNSPTRLEVEYNRSVRSVTPGHGSDGIATVRVEPAEGNGHPVEDIRARYVVGCDGARSTVRKSLGLELKGDSANQAWGVMDVLAVTDFPDIRKKVAIQSANEGNILIIPREGGYLVRFYVELDELQENERVASKDIKVDHLIDAANRIMSPYTLDVKEVAWWSVYEIGQRICDRYDDASLMSSPEKTPTVFIAGDACHTHSPKAGQGMNFSMQDTFNLGWKLAAVIRGEAEPTLLNTYNEERQVVAQDLIDFDREWARMFSDRPKNDEGAEGVDPKEFQQYFVKKGRFTAGTETHYRPSIIVGSGEWQHLATGFVIGKRFHSAPVIRHADAKPLHLGHVHLADGRWRIYAFAGAEDTCASPDSPMYRLCDFLETSDRSPVKNYTPAGTDMDSLIDFRAIFQANHLTLDAGNFPFILRPKKGQYGLVDYEKVFSRDPNPASDIFELRGLARRVGCLVVVRPDQYVANVLPVNGYRELAEFFDRFMVRMT